MKETTTEKLIPTIGLAIGFLIGGAGAAGVGVLLGSEQAVIACYVVGVLGGSAAGWLIAQRFKPQRVEVTESQEST